MDPLHAPYRRDLDGLRAVAVLAVLAFHAFPDELPGGFVGVDVFFVISGFIISGLIFGPVERGTFRFAEFYGRRARRIFPALIVVLAASLAFGWYVLFVDEFRRLALHSAAAAGFVFNFKLWDEAGYFDTAAASKPLLHLWSLSVEEQFYLVWPLLLVTTRRLRLNLLWLTALVAIASFVINIATAASHPTAAFFLPITRFWELMAGSLLAYAQRPGHPRTSWRSLTVLADAERFSDLRAWVGLALVAAGFVFLSEATPYPGWAALFPTLGTVLLLSSGPAWLNRKVLAQPVFVAVGLISYPLYLWHWPLMSFARILGGGEPMVAVRLVLLTISVALAALTYALLERPVRFGPLRRYAAVPLAALLAIVALVGMGLVWERTDADPFALGAGLELAQPGCGVPRGEGAALTFCLSDKREVPVYAVWGDSHGQALFPGLLRASGAGGRWRLIGRPSCSPMAGVRRVSFHPADDLRECAEANAVALRALSGDPALRAVVLVTSRRMLLDETYVAEASTPPSPLPSLTGLSNAVGALEAAGKRVFVVVDNPVLPDVSRCLPRKLRVPGSVPPQCSITFEEHERVMAPYRGLLAALKEKHPRLTLFDPTALLCDRARNLCPVTKDGLTLYSYTDHLSDAGNGLVAPPLIATIGEDKPPAPP